MFINGKNRSRAISQKYEDWRMEAGWLLNKQHPPAIRGPVRLSYALQDGRDKRKRDCGNYEKGVTDLLVSHGVIEADDNTIVRGIHIYWDTDVEGVRITIESEISPGQVDERELATSG